MSKTIYMSICPKCASFKVGKVCPFCKVERIPTGTTGQELMKLNRKQKEELINHYIETLIKDTYDPEARKAREEMEEPPFANYVHESSVSCPYCQSTNVKKISGLSKAGSIALWGIFASSKVGKQWHCNSCGSDF